jgi:hypothetical protein
MYSTFSQEREIHLARELGAVAFVTKPNDFRLLKRILTLVLNTPVSQLPDALRTIARMD